jgi:hypothetical protein
LADNHAAVATQKAWRHYISRCNHIFQTEKAVLIQKNFRGFRARKKFETLLRQKYETQNLNHFNSRARLIQKMQVCIHPSIHPSTYMNILIDMLD